MELPGDNYFANIADLFGKLDGIGDLLEDPSVTSVRLVTNPERMVLRETQRAFVYFSLHGLAVDGVIVNRVLPNEVKDAWFEEWRSSQARILDEIDSYFAPVPVKRVPLFTHEVLGRERLEDLARALYGDKEDPAAVSRTEAPYTFSKNNGCYEVRLRLPFGSQGRRWDYSGRKATNWWWRSARCVYIGLPDLDGEPHTEPRPPGKTGS